MNITIETFANINTVLTTVFLVLAIIAVIAIIILVFKVQTKVSNLYDKAELTISSIYKFTNLPMYFVENIIKRFTK